MAKIDNFKDLTIRWTKHPKYRSNKIIEEEPIEIIVQKLEMILYTNNDDMLDNINIGANLEYWLWNTSVSNEILKSKIITQINQYIPELNIIGYELDLKLFNGEVRDILELNFIINGYNIHFIYQ